ncbi:N-acetyldiaminopimelate deacetylase [Lacticaseibacillus pabuli]|uniref:N-acetyldiaminopimelate deacetylase n=1 Tax=Lacticaseibacillus pabuli TaxID=3025672 RepID=A0ABY7WRX6_9LACO|nr:N-acetyldiaminopimelate deacetylase [Lacticaseibacillus sp. KACC 23028]WDF82481.1 N-acetyldiaminopimelate deacetylase [Lacticaseibacillus sp. KACC 23028]
MDLTASELSQIREDLHQIPELALHETRTHDYLLGKINAWQTPYMTIKAVPAVPTAILVHLAGTRGERTIGYRTDIDALPVTEKTGLPFASTIPGQMHACGHDVHMTIALGILQHFTQVQPEQNMVFFFQPAEENDYGGKRVFDAGAFSGMWRPDEFFGLHDNPQLPAGQIASRMGTLFAGTTEIHLTFTGVSGHAAFPQQANDALVAAAAFVMQVQTVVSRNVDPVRGGVVTIGDLHAGTIGNVIAGSAHLDGTIRAFRQTDIEMMQGRVRAIAEGVAATYGVTAGLQLIQGGYMPVENAPEQTRDLIDFMTADPATDFSDIAPAMTGEDFGFLLQQFPGTMVWLGVGDPQHTLHSDQMSPDEASLLPGVQALTRFLTHRMAE